MSVSDLPPPYEIRAWARRAGVPVGKRGRVSDEAVTAWRAAHPSTPPLPTGTEDELARRLAVQLNENKDLRRKLGEAVESASAAARENAGLRKQLRLAEANLRAMRGRPLDDRAYRRLFSVMTEPPSCR